MVRVAVSLAFASAVTPLTKVPPNFVAWFQNVSGSTVPGVVYNKHESAYDRILKRAIPD